MPVKFILGAGHSEAVVSVEGSLILYGKRIVLSSCFPVRNLPVNIDVNIE